MTTRLALHTLIVIAGVVTRYDYADHADGCVVAELEEAMGGEE